MYKTLTIEGDARGHVERLRYLYGYVHFIISANKWVCARAADQIAKSACARMCVHALQCVCDECVLACVRAYAGGLRAYVL